MSKNFDDLKLAVEMLSGGTNTVIFDDIGMPSIMVAVPKLSRSDLVTGATSDAHYAFLVDSVEKAAVYESKYQNIVANSRAYSLPMQDPRANITWDAALDACRAKGENWGLQPFSLWSAIALWCKKNGFQPHGNNNYGRDASAAWERGVATYSSSGQVNRCATGSGPATWYHDGTRDGIADMNGNVWEWCAGMRLVAGELQFIPYANCMIATVEMGVNSSEWKAIDKDGNYVEPGSSGTVKLDYVSSHWQWTTGSLTSQADSSRNAAFAATTCSSEITDSGKRFLRSMALLPEDGDTDYGGDVFYANNGAAERFPARGGHWADGAALGVFASRLSIPRSYSDAHIGFRSAFYGTL